MKSLHVLSISVITLLMTVSAISQNNCSKFYPFKEGINFQITSYGKNNKVAAITDYTVSQVTNNSATYNSILKDKNQKVLNEGNFKINCENNGITMNLESLLNPQLFDQYRDFETTISGTNIVLPNNLQIGQELPDATMKMNIDMSGIQMEMNVSMTNRKVIDQDTITTPAGSFYCYIISYTNTIEMGMNRTSTSKQWIAEGVGMVKQEDYNRRGNVTSSSLLTRFNK